MMNPLLIAQIRRHWQLVGAVLVFAVFLVMHLAVFQPVAARYQRTLRLARVLGLALDPAQSPHMIPPRVLALLSVNSLPAAVAQEQGSSGALTASLLEAITQLINQHGMRVIATEPGTTAAQPRAVLVRAHLRVECSYGEFVSFLDGLDRSGTLIALDRFSLSGGASGRYVLDLWVTRYILKQTEGRT